MTNADSLWRMPPAVLSLPDDHIHIWRMGLDPDELVVQRLKQTLSADELERAARFHFERDRRHFIVARGVLRNILARYLRTEPPRLRFSYTKYGKPSLIAEVGFPDLNFNVSHSHTMALFAITRGRELGVDIEYIRADFECAQIAERFFSTQENAVLCALPAEMQFEAFFNCWTRKEAYIKAIGEGLSHPLDQFDVSLVPGEPAQLLQTRDDPDEVRRWSMCALFPGEQYAAALVAAGSDWQTMCWQWGG